MRVRVKERGLPVRKDEDKIIFNLALCEQVILGPREFHVGTTLLAEREFFTLRICTYVYFFKHSFLIFQPGCFFRRPLFLSRLCRECPRQRCSGPTYNILVKGSRPLPTLSSLTVSKRATDNALQCRNGLSDYKCTLGLDRDTEMMILLIQLSEKCEYDKGAFSPYSIKCTGNTSLCRIEETRCRISICYSTLQIASPAFFSSFMSNDTSNKFTYSNSIARINTTEPSFFLPSHDPNGHRRPSHKLTCNLYEKHRFY